MESIGAELGEMFPSSQKNVLLNFEKKRQKEAFEEFPIFLLPRERIQKQNSLQLDILVKILSSKYITVNEIANFSETCTFFYHVCLSQSLWKHKCKQRWEMVGEIYNPAHWKRFYIECHLLSKLFFGNCFSSVSGEKGEESKEQIFFDSVKANTNGILSAINKLHVEKGEALGPSERDVWDMFTSKQRKWSQRDRQENVELFRHPLANFTVFLEKSGKSINAKTVLHGFFR